MEIYVKDILDRISLETLRARFIEQYPNLPVPDIPKNQIFPGACDCHAHVFGPWDVFPLSEDRTYTPEETPGSAFIDMLDIVGLDFGVLVQPTVHGVDNSCMVHAISLDTNRLRGVAVVPPFTTLKELRELKDKGVEGIRLSDMADGHGKIRYKNAVPIDAFANLKNHLVELDMHVQLFVDGKALPNYEKLIRQAGVPIVIDHMGRPDVRENTESEYFEVLCKLLSEGLVWVKATQYRPSLNYPSYEDVKPYFDKLVSINPDNIVWGSDWPHINLRKNVPNPGQLINLLSAWSPSDSILQKILCDNPKRLYKF